MEDALKVRRAVSQDAPRLLVLIRDFHAEDRIRHDSLRASKALEAILGDAGLGEVLVLHDAEDAFFGYLVVSVCFSLKQGGRFALLDELYLVPAVRGLGWGGRLLTLANEAAQRCGVERLRLEVHHHNPKAKAIYLAAGFVDDHRDLLTRPVD